jgi:hypothetical protein
MYTTNYKLPAETDLENVLGRRLCVLHGAPEDLSASASTSTVNIRLEMTGHKPTDVESVNARLMAVCDMAWSDSFAVSSRFARENAELVAMAASLQLITTRVTKDVYSRDWQITTKGLRWLNEHKDIA